MDWPMIVWDSTMGSWRLRLREHPPPTCTVSSSLAKCQSFELSSLIGTMPFISRILLGKSWQCLPRMTCNLIAVYAYQPQDGAALSAAHSLI